MQVNLVSVWLAGGDGLACYVAFAQQAAARADWRVCWRTAGRLRNKVDVTVETGENMWCFYSCVGTSENPKDFAGLWAWLMNEEQLHEECSRDLPLSKSTSTDFVADWKARIMYRCLVCNKPFPQRGPSAVECEGQSECKGSRWYHMECVDYDNEEGERFECATCAPAMN